jgi:hypothetical protein
MLYATMLSVVMLDVIIMIVFMPSVVMLNVIMLIFVFFNCYAKCNYAMSVCPNYDIKVFNLTFDSLNMSTF